MSEGACQSDDAINGVGKLRAIASGINITLTPAEAMYVTRREAPEADDG